MTTRRSSHLFFYLIVVSFLLGSEVVMGSCIQFPRDAENPTIEVCEHPDEFTFRISDAINTYPRQEFIARIMQASQKWLSEHNNTAKLTQDSSFQVWMTVPMANPEAAQPRVALFTSKGWLTFWLDLNADEWSFRDKETALLGKDSYPKTFGYRPASIVIQAQDSIPASEVEDTLLKRGATAIVDRGNGYFEARCKLFDEKILASRVGAETSVIKYAEVNSVVEWIADRQMAFSIPLNNQDLEGFDQ